MSERVLDVSHLSPYTNGSQGTLFWGTLGILLVESVVFGCFIASYCYMWMRTPGWPPPGIAPPDLLLPTAATAVLLGSSVFVHWSDKASARGDQRALRWGMLIAVLMAVVVLTLRVLEYRGLDFRWDSHAYGSMFWIVGGFHTLHVSVLVLKTIVLAVLAWRGYFNPQRRLGVEVNGIYWHFIVAVWIPVYLLLYWFPRF